MADHSKTIVTLDVGWCQEVTIDGVIKVSTCCVKTLQNFGLMRCDKVSCFFVFAKTAFTPSVYMSSRKRQRHGSDRYGKMVKYLTICLS